MFSTGSNMKATIEQLLIDKNYTGAKYLSINLLNMSLSIYISSTMIVNIFTLIFVTLALIGWIIVLITEYLQITYCNYVPFGRRYVLHLPFIFLSLTMIGIPFLQNWPYSYHFYLQLPIVIFWLLTLRLKYFYVLQYVQDNFILYRFLLFISVLLLAEEYITNNTEIILLISICIFTLFPSLPKFRKVPFIFIIGWYIISSMLLGATFLMKTLKPNTKYINLTGTIWLLLAGISVLWASPKKNTLFLFMLTCILAAAMWLSTTCFVSSKYCDIIMNCTWPLITVIIVPIFGNSNSMSKLVQCIIAFGIPVICTSTTLEPLVLLLILGCTAGWAAVESFYSISNWDNLRRMFIIIYLFMLAEKLTATDTVSFKCLICELTANTDFYLFILTQARLLIIYASIMITYRLVLGSEMFGYSSAILGSLVITLAALRSLIQLAVISLQSDNLENYLYQHIRINCMAIILILSYNIAMIYGRNHKHLAEPSVQSLEFSEL